MFSLIITIISIALVAALALATLYYGGGAFSQGNAQAAAARHILQGQQVLGAAELFKVDQGRWPDSMEEMVSGHYLRSAPSSVALGGAGVLGQAQAEGAVVVDSWTVVKAGRPVYRLLGVKLDACLSVNQKSFGVAGVLSQLRASWAAQCYSPTAGSYAVVVTKDEESLVDVFGAEVTQAALPGPGSARWVVRPGSRTVASSSPGGAANPSSAGVPVAFDSTGAATVPVVYTNTTGSPLTFNSPPFIAGDASTSAYTVTSDCPAQLAPGQSCTALVTYAPGIEPAYSGTLVFDTSAARTEVPLVGDGLPKVAPPAITSVPLASAMGTGLPEVAPPPGAESPDAPAPGTFAPVKPGVPSTRDFTITNTAETPLVSTGAPLITGAGAAAFSSTSNCPASLAPGASCTVTVTFVPDAPGVQEAVLTLPFYTTSPVTVPLLAEGLTLQDATPSVAQYDFQDVPLAQQSDFLMGLDNTGTAVLHLLSLPRIEEDVTGAFSVVANNCAATLAAGAGCDVTVRFTPTVLGAVSAMLAVDTDASGSPLRIALSGFGLSSLVPLAQLSTATLDFGNVATNTTVKSQVLMSNPGNGRLTLTAAPAVTAGSDLAFNPGLTTCAGSLAVNASCVTEVVYSPTAVGAANGTLTFATNAAGSPSNVTLSGTAYNPVSLAAATLPAGTVGLAYAPFNLSSLLGVSNETSPTLSDVVWSSTGTLPAGLSLSSSGVLSGTPTAATTGAAFTVLATYKLNKGQQAYTLPVVNFVLVDYSSLMAGYTGVSYAIGRRGDWTPVMGNTWYWRSPNSNYSAASGTVSYRQSVTVAETAGVAAYLRGAVDDSFVGFAVNGAENKGISVGGMTAAASSATFTLLPGVNVIEVLVNNSGVGPAGMAIEVRKSDGTLLAPLSAWKFVP